MTGRTDRPLPLLAGLIGWPVAQSKSQKIHEFWLKRLGIDGHYVRLPVRPGEVARAFRGMVALGFTGVQATMPHKRACYDLVDHHTAAARALGAVNTVIVEDDGSLTGENTDLPGFIEPLAGLNLAGERVTVLGAGGAAAAVPSSRTTITAPTFAVSPTLALIAATRPALGEGIVTAALSVSTSTSGSSSLTLPPTSTCHLRISPSWIPSPRSGSLNSNTFVPPRRPAATQQARTSSSARAIRGASGRYFSSRPK